MTCKATRAELRISLLLCKAPSSALNLEVRLFLMDCLLYFARRLPVRSHAPISSPMYCDLYPPGPQRVTMRFASRAKQTITTCGTIP